MIERWIAVIAMSFAIAAPAQAATDIERVVSPGGIEAWLVSDDTLPVIAMDFAFRGGAAQDPADKPGIANLMSGLLDEGAGDLTAREFQERLEDSAVEMSFDIGQDAFYGRIRTLAENRAEAFEMLRLAVNEPRFDADAVERIRSRIGAQLRRDANDPGSVARRTFYAMAYPDHPYGRPSEGTAETVAAITRDDLVGYHGRTFARDNLVVVAVGAIDAAGLAAALDEVFGALPEKADLAPVPEVTLAGVGDTRVVELNVPQTTLIFGRPGLKREDEDFIPAFVLNHILGGGSFTSRLFTEVREKRGLSYGVYTGTAALDHTGLLVGSVATRNDRARESMEVIAAEMKKIVAEPPSPEELDKAKRFLTGSYALRFDSSTKISRQLLQIRLDGLGIDYVDRRNGLIEAVTREDLARAAARLVGDGALLVAAAGKPEGLANGSTPAGSGAAAPAREAVPAASEPTAPAR